MRLDNLIAQRLREEEARDKALHTPSGKLSASQLSKPLLEQVLKLIGVPQAPFSDYSLRLFKRGKQVEEWICSMLDGEEQIETEYRNTIGYIDKMINGTPVEIKSVKSSQWKWLEKQGPNPGYCMQAALYALGTNSDESVIIMVSADDFRTQEHTIRTIDWKDRIDSIIDEVDDALKSRTLPAFTPREDWQGKPEYADKYSSYPDWVSLPPELAMQKLRNDYPDSYKKLTGEK